MNIHISSYLNIENFLFALNEKQNKKNTQIHFGISSSSSCQVGKNLYKASILCQKINGFVHFNPFPHEHIVKNGRFH
jgi:hypothetical protein